MAKTRIERNLPNRAYQAAVEANAPGPSNPYATINDLQDILPNGNILISGGASYSGTGMVFDVSVLVYLIDGIEYTSAETSVTLADGDPSNARFDAIVADEDLVVSVVQGTPSADPITPSIGSDQVLVQFVLVGAGALTPTITTEFVYQEDGTTHWLGGFAGGFGTTADFASSTPPAFQGTKCTLATLGRYGSRRGVNFSTGTPVARSEYVLLSFRIYLPADLEAADISYFRVFAYEDNTAGAQSIGWAEAGNYVDFSLTGAWQLVTIPTGLFGANIGTATTIGYINFSLYRGPGTVLNPTAQIALDDIKLQTGFGPQLNTATIDVLSEGDVVGATSKIDFRSANGLFTRTSVDIPDGTILVSPNSPKTDAIASVGAGVPWVIDTTSTTVAEINNQSASPLTIADPTGSATNGQRLIVKIKDNGLAVTISFGSAWTAFTGVSLPSSSGSGKWIYLTAYYNVSDTNWHVIDVKEEV